MPIAFLKTENKIPFSCAASSPAGLRFDEVYSYIAAMSSVSNYIGYLRNCYEADNDQQQLFNLFDSKFTHLRLLQNGDLLDGNNYHIEGKAKWIDLLYEEYEFQRREKPLFACSLILAGKLKTGNTSKEIAAPLFFFPMELSKLEDQYHFKINTEDGAQINSNLIRSLVADPENPTAMIEDWNPFFNMLSLDESACTRLMELIEQKYPSVDASALVSFPSLLPKETIQNQTDGKLRLLPVVGIATVEKQKASIGILNELRQIQKADDFPDSMHELFGKDKSRRETWADTFSRYREDEDVLLPINLSRSQEEIIKASRKFPLSIIVGPPGTGKSFTIAGLAVDAIALGNRSVLIACNSEQALDVLQNKIENDYGLKNLVMRPSSKYKGGEAAEKLSLILTGDIPQVDEEKMTLLQKEIARLRYGQKKFRKKYWSSIDKERSTSLFKFDFENTSKDSEWASMRQLSWIGEVLKRRLREYLPARIFNQWNEAIKEDVSSLEDLYKGIKSEHGVKRDEFFNSIDDEQIKRVFPIWLVTLDDLANVLPLRKEFFDLVVLDEGTQCDIARAIPAFYRSKAAIIAGDPEQLRHVSFLSESQMDLFRSANDLQDVPMYEIDYREMSLLDFAMASIKRRDQIHFLNEHYRSYPSLIRFSNTEFYHESLKIMTRRPKSAEHQNLHYHTVVGERDKRGINVNEGSKIIEIIQKRIRDEKNKNEFHTTIGIISPFSDQVKYLGRTIKNEISIKNRSKHKILVGTPFSFQGEERDLILISLALDDNSHPSAFRHINKTDVFNVSITRARKEQHVLCSLTSNKMDGDSLLYRFIQDVKKGDEIEESSKKTIRSAKEVENWLKTQGVRNYFTNFQMAGIQLDYFIETDKLLLAIDLIGFEGVQGDPIPEDDLDSLDRLGIQIFPLSFTDWHQRSYSTRKSLSEFLVQGWDLDADFDVKLY